MYEGSGDNVGTQTGPDSFQLNRKINLYLDEVKEVFPNSVLGTKIIISKI